MSQQTQALKQATRNTSPLRQRRSAPWLVLLGNVGLFALSSGVGGMAVGALVGVANYNSGPSYSLGAGGFLVRNSWWQVVRFCLIANGIWMALLGALVGGLLFLFLRSVNGNWPLLRRARFARGLQTRLFLPLAFTIALSGAATMVVGGAGLTSKTLDLGSIVEFVGMAMLPLGAFFWTWLLGRFSKRPRRQRPKMVGRLLPVD